MEHGVYMDNRMDTDVLNSNLKHDSETKDPIVSVIVPIYNVQSYLRKCLDSLNAQTLKYIEIICIDDGSTDQSGKIAEEYQNETGWPIFRVIHTENRGLSAARNRGIDEAKAEWIMFVDSDDWVSEKFCEIPWKRKDDAALIIFGAYEVRGKTIKGRKSLGPIGVISEFEAHEFGGIVSWNKLYRKELFDKTRFPEGRLFEDIATTHKIVHKAKKICRIEEKLYYHLWRKNSISHLKTVENKTESFILSRERSKDLIRWGYPEEKTIPTLAIYALGFLATTKAEELRSEAEQILNSIKKMPDQWNTKQKIAFVVWKKDKRKKLFYLLSKIYP